MSDDDDHGNETDVPRGRPFVPGQSGNPTGRPKGSRNRTNLMMQALIEGKAEGILEKALEKAEVGDPRMLSFFLKLLVKPERFVMFELPEIRTPADAAKVTESVLKEVSKGEMSIEEAERIMALVPMHLQVIEELTFERRLEVLERCFAQEEK